MTPSQRETHDLEKDREEEGKIVTFPRITS